MAAVSIVVMGENNPVTGQFVFDLPGRPGKNWPFSACRPKMILPSQWFVGVDAGFGVDYGDDACGSGCSCKRGF